MRIGLEQTEYIVHEGTKYQVVCTEVLSGNVAGKEIEISYSTTITDTLGIFFAVEPHVYTPLIMYMCTA